MVRSLTCGAAVLWFAGGVLGGCEKTAEKPQTETVKPAPAPAAAVPDATPAPKPAEATPPPKPETAEIVFDPANPPPGYGNCHRNHCHRLGGGVASYAQVMQEMGATKIKDAPAAVAMPAAPADVAAPPANGQVTTSGLVSVVLSPGSGTSKPSPTSRVSVHYTGWTSDGQAFDSSVARGRPAQFPLDRVIPGWGEGLQLMVVGEERRFWIPADLAYAGKPGRPQGMLVFDVELLEILD
jgi:FKBP-type peptidyl-prolyl cis-trans isomerase